MASESFNTRGERQRVVSASLCNIT